MPNAQLDKIVQELRAAGVPKAQIYRGMNEVYNRRYGGYSMYRIRKLTDGIIPDPDSNYNHDMRSVHDAYMAGKNSKEYTGLRISKDVYYTYLKDKPGNMAYGYGIRHKLPCKMYKGKYIKACNATEITGFENWESGSP